MQKLSYLGKNRTVCFSQWNPRKNNGLWNQPISSEQTSALKAGQVATVVDNMEEFSEEHLPNFFIFSSSNTNERFPWLQEEEINTLRSTNENSNIATSTKTWLNVFNEWKLQRNEARRFKDIPEELYAILCRFFAEIRKRRQNEEDEEFLWQSGQLGKLLRFQSVFYQRQFP